jgi:hypothetical protein
MSRIRLGITVSNLLNPIVAVEDFNYDKDPSTIPHCLTTETQVSVRRTRHLRYSDRCLGLQTLLTSASDKLARLNIPRVLNFVHQNLCMLTYPGVSAIDDANNVDQGYPSSYLCMLSSYSKLTIYWGPMP